MCPDLVLQSVAYVAESGLAHATISVYLSGLRFTQIAMGLPYPQLGSIPRLHYVLRGIRQLVGQASSWSLPPPNYPS